MRFTPTGGSIRSRNCGVTYPLRGDRRSQPRPGCAGRTVGRRQVDVGTAAVRGQRDRLVRRGAGDLDASIDAFTVLDSIVAARVRRGLNTVIDTLGLDADRRAAAVAVGRAGGLPVIAVRF